MQKLYFFVLSVLFSFSLAAQVTQTSPLEGFSTISNLNPLPISGNTTKDMPQAKVWTYAGKWWSVLPTTSGTKILRLDGSTWTPVLTLMTTGSKPDCRVVGNMVHILLFKGASSNSYIYSVEYDPATDTYKPWSQRSAGVTLSMPAGSFTATLAVDGKGRMWVASSGVSEVNVWWSDAPYTSWSAPIQIANGIADEDICTIATLPGKIGVLWSNHNSDRFGFKTHTDGADPAAWSADEVPASQSALAVGGGMADNHMNVKVAADGTMYCAVKTSYDKTGYPQLALLVRRPAGNWDSLYQVTSYSEGTQPILLFNEAQGKLKVVYTTVTTGGDIMYRESSTSPISFGPARTLLNAGGLRYNYATTTHQNYSSSVVVLATNLSTSPYEAVGVIATDAAPADQNPPVVQSINRQSPAIENTSSTSLTYRVIFSEAVKGVDVSDFTLTTVSGTVSGTLTANAVSPVGTDGVAYDVTASSITGSGTLRLDVKSSGTGITDIAGNALSSGFTAGQTYNFQEQTLSSYGFASVTPLAPLNITDYTKDKPQAKAWKYAGKWWCVLPNGSNGVMILRLDGTSWTNTLTIRATDNARADCRVVGDLVHILLFKGASQNSSLTTVQYDPALGKYKFWPQRTSNVNIVFPANSETATLVADTKGRLWVASDGVTDMTVRWSDAPYTTWSAPITIASGAKDDDICALVEIPSQGKIGLFWSNQVTQRFGFRTHSDGADPMDWSTDEMPASQSAINYKYGMADDHMNIAVASDGTMYCGVKTGYNTAGYPQLSMLVRRPSGSWDDLYPVTLGEGTQPLVVLNEAKGRVKVVYTTNENGGEIVYRESSTANISFGEQVTLISGGGYLYNYATSTHQTYDPEVVILATQQSTSPLQAVSVLASDEALFAANSIQAAVERTPVEQHNSLAAYPNPFSGQATVSFSLEQAGEYSLSLYDMKGSRLAVLRRGVAEAGQLNTVRVDGSALSSGFYLVRLETKAGTQTLKMILKK